MTEEYEGLCESDYFSRTGKADHWKGTVTRRSPKGRTEVAWNHVSPSQIETYVKCPRAWFFKSILKIPEAQKGHQSLGEAFHLIMEKTPQGLPYDKADVSASPEDWVKAEAMASQALPLLPVADQTFFRREWGIRLDTYENGPTMVGYVDLGIKNGVGFPSLLIPNNEAVVVDYKTLSDFRYMRTPQELAESVQMMTYAKWAIEPWPSGLHAQEDPIPDHVRLLHLYARTKPPFIRSAIRCESAIVTPGEINTQWNKTLDIVREMEHLSTRTDPQTVEAGGALNGHCEAYGGCHFRDKCGIAKSNGIKGLFQIGKKPATTPTEANEMSGSAILEKIRAARALAEGTTPQPQATAATSTPVSTVPTTVHGQEASPVLVKTVEAAPTVSKGPYSGLMAKIASKGGGKPTLTGVAGAAYAKENGYAGTAFSGNGALAKTTVSTLGELMKLASGVVPPDAPSRTQEVLTQPGETVVDPLTIDEPTEEGEDDEELSTATAGVVVSSTVPMPTLTQAAPVVKRGRPSAADVAAREAAEKAKFDAAVQAEVAKRGIVYTASTPEADADALVGLQTELAQAKSEIQAMAEQHKRLQAQRNTYTPPTAEGLTLYVDCFPTKGEPEVVDFFEWIGPICAAVAQSNAVQDYRLINYTAKGLLASAIREVVKAEGTPKAMTISSCAGGADIALEILTPIAKRVIKKL